MPLLYNFFNPGFRFSCYPLLTSCMLLMSCTPPEQQQYSPQVVQTQPVAETLVHHQYEFSGRLASVEFVEVRPQIAGKIEKIHFTEGQIIQAGDVLFSLDSRPYQAAYEAALAELELAQAQHALAEKQNSRAQEMISRNAISRDEYDTRANNLAQAIARVQAAKAYASQARTTLDYATITAPVSGRIARANITLGNLVSSENSQPLTTIVSIDPMFVYFDIDEQSLQAMAIDHWQPLAKQFDVAVSFSGLQAKQPATIDFIDNQLNTDTGTLRFRATLPNPDYSLRPGLFARVHLQQQRQYPAIVIDEKAILVDQDRRYVYVITADNTAIRRDITLGSRFQEKRIISAGLTTGEQLVVSGVQKIFYSGMPVAPNVINDRGQPE